MTDAAADEALEQAQRLWFGRLVGWLFRMTGDLQLAEDAVGSAFVAAVSAWRTNGVPDSPEAWLRVVARNNAMTALKRNARTMTVDPASLTGIEDASAGDGMPMTARIDDRLKLMFVCAHPAIDPRMHAPLMLQAVLGVDAARIASVFLVTPATMGQRLSRAKTKIRDAGIRFRTPDEGEFDARLGSVLQAVYASYGIADPTADSSDDRDASLRGEAVRLAQLLTELLPTQAETWGLLALLLHTESRRPARLVDGEFVPLADQDTSAWSTPMRRRADECLRRASSLRSTGRFQLEAAISAIHSSRADGIPTDWDAIVILYRGLLRIAPSIGATIGAAGAMAERGEIREAAALLDAIPPEAVRSHQPYWVCRARVSTELGDLPAASAAASVAIGLTTDPAVRRYLTRTMRA